MSFVNPTEDNTFYFQNVVIRVEDTLFCVPRLILQQNSSAFRDMFRLPTGPNNEGEGSNSGAPIVLEGTNAWDFRLLLRAIFCRYAEELEQSEPTTIEEWTAVYKLSQRWEMTALNKYAKEKLWNLAVDPVEKAGLAQDLSILEWKIPAFQEIARRPEPLSMREVDRLGIHTVLKLAHVRESISSYGGGSNHYVGDRDASKLDFTRKIQTVFDGEVEKEEVQFQSLV